MDRWIDRWRETEEKKKKMETVAGEEGQNVESRFESHGVVVLRVGWIDDYREGQTNGP